MRRATFCCAPCRRVSKGAGIQFPFVSQGSEVCPECRSTMEDMGTRWRAPRKTDDKAWAKVTGGEFMWDEKARGRFGYRRGGAYDVRPPWMAWRKP